MSKVRPLAWNPEFPQILATGSWDGSVIIWDVYKQIPLYKYQFNSDIYGLDFSARRPFELVVTSRDLSIQILFLRDLSQRLLDQLIIRPIEQYFDVQLRQSVCTAESVYSIVEAKQDDIHAMIDGNLKKYLNRGPSFSQSEQGNGLELAGTLSGEVFGGASQSQQEIV